MRSASARAGLVGLGGAGACLLGGLLFLAFLSGPARATPPTSTAPEAPAVDPRREELVIRPDEPRPVEQRGILLFGRRLTLGGEVETRLRFEGDPRLGEVDDDRGRLRQELELELFYPASDRIALVAEGRYVHRFDFHREGAASRGSGSLRRGETFVDLLHLFDTPLRLRVGRQHLRDGREWWWEESLDAVRLIYDDDRVRAELAVAQELAPDRTGRDHIDPEQADVLRVFGSARWRYRPRHRLELFGLLQEDHSRTHRVGSLIDAEREDEVDADLTWLGLRATGRFRLPAKGRLYYWLDAGYVTGDESVLDFDPAGEDASVVDGRVEREVEGHAFDGGFTLATRLPGRPALTLGYAFGSGDRNPESGRERAFRQTGLQDNDGRFRGVNRFRYYGILLDPELSNLHIATAAIGVRLAEETSLELLYHYYRQVHAAAELRDAGIRARPTGLHRSLGHALDLVLGVEEWSRLRLELAAGVFRAGAAFGERRRELAFGLGVEVDYAF